jgi:hypothetical protein
MDVGAAPAFVDAPSTTDRLFGPVPDGRPQPGFIVATTTGDGTDISLIDPADGLTEALSQVGSHGLPVVAIAWSPDGKALLFDQGYPNMGCAEYVVVTLDGSLVRPFRMPPGQILNAAVWAPDGSAIYAVHEAGTDIGDSSQGAVADDWGSLWRIPLDGSPITNFGAPCDTCEVTGPLDWSPDGSTLAARYVPYHSRESRAGSIATVTPLGEWTTIDDCGCKGGKADGSKLLGWFGSDVLEITQSLQVRHFVRGDPAGPTWTTIPLHRSPENFWIQLSPDGTMLSTTRWPSSKGVFTLRVVNLASGMDEAIWSGKALSSVAWAPDSSAIAARLGTTELLAVNADGTGLRRFHDATTGALAWQPVWTTP